MRALRADELEFVGGADRPQNPYTDFKNPDGSKEYWAYEMFINAVLKEAGLDHDGNPISSIQSTNDALGVDEGNNPSFSVTAGNKAGEFKATYKDANGRTLTGTLLIPYDGGQASWKLTWIIPF